MKLRLKHLQGIAQKAISDEHVLNSLRSNVIANFGNVVVESASYDQVVAAANEAIDMLEATGFGDRDLVEQFDSDVLVSLAKSNDSAARRLYARVAPISRLNEVVNDKSASVRYAVARRIDIDSLTTMVERFDRDDQLNVIFRERLNEAGKKPKKSKKPNSGAAEPVELSDAWYRTQAKLFVADYGRQLDDTWEETSVVTFCNGVKATSGVDIDPKRLLDAVIDELEAKRERTLKRNELKESVSFAPTAVVRRQPVDPVKTLLTIDENKRTQYISAAIGVYSIKESNRSGRPLIEGKLPTSRLRESDERALSRFCEAWSIRAQTAGRNASMGWAHDIATNRVIFEILEV